MGWISELSSFIREFGFTTLVALLAMYAVYKMFQMREETSRQFQLAIKTHAEAIARVSHDSNTALGMNTLATQALTEEIKKKFDSDKLEKDRKTLIEEFAASQGCKANEIAALLREQMRRDDERRIRDRAEHAEEKIDAAAKRAEDKIAGT